MKKAFSKSWLRSTQQRKQRKYRYNAPLHLRRSMLSAHLQKSLRREVGRRSLPVRKGDEVEVMRGKFRGRRGVVSGTSMKSLKIYVETIKRKKVSGQDVQVAIEPSNVMITKLNMEDRKRKKMLARKAKAEGK